jgi:alpha-methylacyl-CoA racemase
MGLLAAMLEAQRSGEGQVVDVAITDGVISLMAPMQGFKAMGLWETGERQQNMLDGGAHYYDTYECADGKYISIGSIEPQFYAQLIEVLGVDIGEPGFHMQSDKHLWKKYKPVVAQAFLAKTCAQWCDLMEGTDICFAPVLDMNEATQHAHNVARGSFVEREGVVQTAPAPRFSRTPGSIQGPPVAAGENTREVLASCGYQPDKIDALLQTGVVASSQ